MRIKQITFIILTFIITGCVSQRSSTIVSCNYNKDKNQTEYLVFPYGEVSIPGKWEKDSYNTSSRQQFFYNSENIIISIAFGLCNKFEFNSDNSKTDILSLKHIMIGILNILQSNMASKTKLLK